MIESEPRSMAIIKILQTESFGHVMRKEGLGNSAMTGVEEGIRSGGKQRYKFTDKPGE